MHFLDDSILVKTYVAHNLNLGIRLRHIKNKIQSQNIPTSFLLSNNSSKPFLPMETRVMNKSVVGDELPLPGYVSDTPKRKLLIDRYIKNFTQQLKNY